MPGRTAPQASTIARPRLERRLDGALDRRLTCVVAGAGFGKTTLVSGWAATTPRAMSAWHGLTAGDRTLTVVVRAVTDALRLCVPELPADLVAAASGPRGPDTGTDEAGRAQAYAGRICEALAAHRGRDVVLVLDDAEALDGAAESAAFVAGLCRQAPAGLHVVLCSRREPPFPVARMRGQGQLLDLSATELAFTPAETEQVVRATIGDIHGGGGVPGAGGAVEPPGVALGIEPPGVPGHGEPPDLSGLAAELHQVTAGWPAAVRLTCEALARDADPGHYRATLARLRRPGGELYDYLADEVVAAEDDLARGLLVRLAALDRFTPDLAAALAPGGDAALAGLVRRGAVVDAPGRGDAWLSVNALVREVVGAMPGADAARRETLGAAAGWFEEQGRPAEALRCTLATPPGSGGEVGRGGEAGAGGGPSGEALRLVTQWGPELLRAGEADTLLTAVAHLDPAERTDAVDRLEGDARQLLGDWDGALACYGRAAGEAPDGAGAGVAGRSDTPLPPGLAWRMGLIHHLRGELDAALAVYERGDLGEGDRRRTAPTAGRATIGDTSDQALLVAWTATAHWLRGDAASCRALAGDAMARARRSGDDRALAAAHTVRALVAAHDGDRLANDSHYLRALDHAERAGDLLQVIRIRLNRGSRLNEEGFYDEAIAELDLAIGHADLGGYAAFKAIALGNRGEARGHLGQFDQAADDLDSATAIFQKLGSLLVAYPLSQAGHIHAARGQTALARAAFTEAVEVSRTSGDLQGLVPGLAGLARLVAGDDPAAARALADEAVALGHGLSEVEALLAQGWTALAAGERDEATAIAGRVLAIAAERRDRAALADATELLAMAAPPERAGPGLRDALGLWEELRDPLGQGRVLLALARLGGPDAAAQALRAERLLRPLGARRLAVEAARLASAARPVPAVAIHCLGGFAVLRDGAAVPVGEWKSRKARDLVKVLIARDGRPVHRGTLLELLWPGEDPDQTASRLSVALSTARAVLDPAKTFPAGWFLAADADTVWIDVDHAEVDLVRFAELAAAAAAERKSGPGPSSTDALAAAEVAYVGDAFPEDPYEDWTVSSRERARASYLSVARTLADDSAAAGDAATAVRCYLRVIEHDPYDEHAHLGLVGTYLAAGQQGEARRAYRAYCARMEDIGVEAAPFPSVPASARS
ncbi:MAG TPA: BTAD domain-containing putative transcriptional regulator [Acidimicrobiales bacterium]|nr:BTAD domain-containing putative transcriptional regulator [Acidimicrobiales bacterium]